MAGQRKGHCMWSNSMGQYSLRPPFGYVGIIPSLTVPSLIFIGSEWFLAVPACARGGTPRQIRMLGCGGGCWTWWQCLGGGLPETVPLHDLPHGCFPFLAAPWTQRRSHARDLAECFRRQNQWNVWTLRTPARKEEINKEVWIQLIIYAASKSRPEMHAAQLARGGDRAPLLRLAAAGPFRLFFPREPTSSLCWSKAVPVILRSIHWIFYRWLGPYPLLYLSSLCANCLSFSYHHTQRESRYSLLIQHYYYSAPIVDPVLWSTKHDDLQCVILFSNCDLCVIYTVGIQLLMHWWHRRWKE